MRREARQPDRRWAGQPLTVFGLLGSGLAVVIGGIGLDGALLRRSSTVAADTAATSTATGPASAAASRAVAMSPTTVDMTPGRVTSTAAQSAPVTATHPVTLQIPSIGVNSQLELLGVAADGTLQTPKDPEKAGWFTGSSLPGDPGPVVIAGHVDAKTGPAVFLYLRSVRAGDPITILLSNGKRVTYRATAVTAYAKDKFPTQSVYGPRPDSELRLITCGGAFVKGQYVDDVVVFAKLS